jgi:hypothetical protein
LGRPTSCRVRSHDGAFEKHECVHKQSQASRNGLGSDATRSATPCMACHQSLDLRDARWQQDAGVLDVLAPAAPAHARTAPCMSDLSRHHPHGSHKLYMPVICATEVDEGAGRQVFDLSLTELGPYRVDVTRSGRLVVLGGRKGHLAMLDWHQMRTVCELQVLDAHPLAHPVLARRLHRMLSGISHACHRRTTPGATPMPLRQP